MAAFIVITIIMVIILIITSVKTVPNTEVWIVERLGKYYDTWETGVHFKMPFIDRIARRLITTNLIVEVTCSNMETYDQKIVNLKVFVTLKITDYYKYVYSQAPKQFENLIYDELSSIILKCPVDKIEASLKQIEYKMFKIVEQSPIMNNIGLSCLELSIKMNESANF